MTAARRSLIGVLLGASGHLSAEEILTQVRCTQPEVDSSTVYRNLAALQDMGVVVHVHLNHGPAVYHLAGDVHAHIVCSGCGLVAEVPASGLAVAMREVLAASASGFGLSGQQHFALTGLCGRCRQD